MTQLDRRIKAVEKKLPEPETLYIIYVDWGAVIPGTILTDNDIITVEEYHKEIDHYWQGDFNIKGIAADQLSIEVKGIPRYKHKTVKGICGRCGLAIPGKCELPANKYCQCPHPEEE